MIDWWTDQPSWLRYSVCLGLIGIGTLLFFTGTRRGQWVAAPGIGLLLFAGQTPAERKGYRF